jgi:hypothetical protein
MYNSKAEARLSSSEDEDDEEEENKRQSTDDDMTLRRSPAGGVAGGTTSTPPSVTRQHTPPSDSPKPRKFGYQPTDSVSSVVCVCLSVCRGHVHDLSDSHHGQYGYVTVKVI